MNAASDFSEEFQKKSILENKAWFIFTLASPWKVAEKQTLSE